MSDYIVETIHDDGNVDVRFPDGSWARVKTHGSMTQEDFDEEVWKFKPAASTESPSFLSEGQNRTSSPKPGPVPVAVPEWLDSRIEAYGTVESQVEYITENGLEAWQAHVAVIKAQYPKT